MKYKILLFHIVYAFVYSFLYEKYVDGPLIGFPQTGINWINLIFWIFLFAPVWMICLFVYDSSIKNARMRVYRFHNLRSWWLKINLMAVLSCTTAYIIIFLHLKNCMFDFISGLIWYCGLLGMGAIGVIFIRKSIYVGVLSILYEMINYKLISTCMINTVNILEIPTYIKVFLVYISLNILIMLTAFILPRNILKEKLLERLEYEKDD